MEKYLLVLQIACWIGHEQYADEFSPAVERFIAEVRSVYAKHGLKLEDAIKRDVQTLRKLAAKEPRKTN